MPGSRCREEKYSWRAAPSSSSSSPRSLPSQPRERRKASSSAGIRSLSLRLPLLFLLASVLALVAGSFAAPLMGLMSPAVEPAAAGVRCCSSSAGLCVAALCCDTCCAGLAGEAGSGASVGSAGVAVSAAAPVRAAAPAGLSSPSPRGARLGERLLRRRESKKLLRSRSREAPASFAQALARLTQSSTAQADCELLPPSLNHLLINALMVRIICTCYNICARSVAFLAFAFCIHMCVAGPVKMYLQLWGSFGLAPEPRALPGRQ